jgi:hypothetical protein
MRIFDYMKGYSYLFLYYVLMVPMCVIGQLFTRLAGWRWADGGWIFKWYRKTNHGRRLEEKIGRKIDVGNVY